MGGGQYPGDVADNHDEDGGDKDEGEDSADHGLEGGVVAEGSEVGVDVHGLFAFFDGDVDVIVVAAGDIGWVVRAAAVVGAPAFVVADKGPDLVLSDDVFNAEDFDIGFEPVGQHLPDFPLLVCGILADEVVEGDAAGSSEGRSDFCPGRGE